MDKILEAPKVTDVTGEGAGTGANQHPPPDSSTVSPWMRKLLSFVPERMANLMVETGYEDEESFMCSVSNKSDAQ